MSDALLHRQSDACTTLDDWVARATKGLSKESAARVHADAHSEVQSSIVTQGISESAAITGLIDPVAASKQYRKKMLTTYHERFLRTMFGPSRLSLRTTQGWIQIIAFSLICIIGFALAPDPALLFSYLVIGIVLSAVAVPRMSRAVARATTETARDRFERLSIYQHVLVAAAFFAGPHAFNAGTDQPIDFTMIFASTAAGVFLAARQHHRFMANADDCITIIKQAWEDETL